MLCSFNSFLLFAIIYLSMFAFIVCQDQKRMSELVSYLSRQRTHTPPDKTENKQKTKEVRLCSKTMFAFFLCDRGEFYGNPGLVQNLNSEIKALKANSD